MYKRQVLACRLIWSERARLATCCCKLAICAVCAASCSRALLGCGAKLRQAPQPPNTTASSTSNSLASVGSVSYTHLDVYKRQAQNLYIFALALFSVGAGVGSMSCEKLSGRTVEIGLVPLGAFGISAFLLDLYFARPGPALSLIHILGSLLHR